MTVLVWTLLVITAFGLALAVQMRVMVSAVLRRALAAKFGGDAGAPAYVAAIRDVGRSAGSSEIGAHLAAVYPMPLRHLGLARLACLVLPGVVLALVLVGRFGLRAI